MKFFQLASTTDDQPSGSPVHTHWSALHDVYDPSPNAPGQGKEGSGEVHVFSTVAAGTRHRSVYSIVLDEEAQITRWHVYLRDDDDTVVLEKPDGSEVAFSLPELLKEVQ